jgi:hypothetical protein
MFEEVVEASASSVVEEGASVVSLSSGAEVVVSSPQLDLQDSKHF